MRGREKSGDEIRGGAIEDRTHVQVQPNSHSDLLKAAQSESTEIVNELRQTIARLQDELRAANYRAEEASRRLDLIEWEKQEIEGELDSMIRSTGWRFLKRFRTFKSRFLPPGTNRRRIYDGVMMRFASRKSPSLNEVAAASKPANSWSEPTKAAERVPATPIKEAEAAGSTCCSIIIPVRNRAIFTQACLLAIEKSVCTDKIPYEAIVVDNGSTDDTAELLTAWALSRTNARILRFPENLGFARACNKGARLARGRYLLLLNNDTLPTPGWLEKMVRLIEHEGPRTIVGSKLLFPDGRIQHMGVAFDEAKNPAHIYRGFPSDFPPAQFSREYQAVTAACLLIDRDLYWSVGGLDEAYKNSYEDIDLCLKVRARAGRVLSCGEATVYHFESISAGRHTRDFRNRALLKNRWANAIRSDLNSWYTHDGISEASTQFEPHGTYEPKQEKTLRDLWRRIYLEPFPQEEFNLTPQMKNRFA